MSESLALPKIPNRKAFKELRIDMSSVPTSPAVRMLRGVPFRPARCTHFPPFNPWPHCVGAGTPLGGRLAQPQPPAPLPSSPHKPPRPAAPPAMQAPPTRPPPPVPASAPPLGVRPRLHPARLRCRQRADQEPRWQRHLRSLRLDPARSPLLRWPGTSAQQCPPPTEWQ